MVTMVVALWVSRRGFWATRFLLASLERRVIVKVVLDQFRVMARKSRGKRRTRPEATVDVEDVDEFISNRHKVMLERDEGEEGDDVSEEEEDVPVMDIGGVEEEDDSDDDEEEEGEEEEVESGGWTMKRSFYGGDNAEFNIMSSDEEEQLREEEVEAVKMQRKEAEAMMTQDFGLVDDDEDEADDDEEESNDDRTYSKKKTKSKKDETFRAESDVPTSVMDSVQRALANPSDEDDDDDDDDVDEPDALKLLASTVSSMLHNENKIDPPSTAKTKFELFCTRFNYLSSS